MKIKISPAAYIVSGSSVFKDRLAINESYANGIISERGSDGSKIEPLHPESLVIELAEALESLMFWDNGKSEYETARALLEKVIDQTSEAS